MNFYTNVTQWGDNILFRGVQNGKRIRKKIKYRPTLYTVSKNTGPLKTLDGKPVEPIHPGTIKECKDYIETFKGVAGGEVYGNDRFPYAFIAEFYPEEIEWDISQIIVANIDIEVGSENGFPDPKTAVEEITAITLKLGNTFYAFGYHDFITDDPSIKYYKAKDEVDLIMAFLKLWITNYPDVVTGWNCKFFDFPYIINRIKRLLGDDIANKISPWGSLLEREAMAAGRMQQFYDIIGLTILDYMEIYRKFADHGASQESYKLNAIAHVEVGEKKISYDEYDNLHILYKQNPQKFMEYNIHDVRLVDKIDNKLGLIELCLTLAYEAKANYIDVLAQTRMWDAITYNHLIKQDIVFPPMVEHTKTTAYEGAYVKEPMVGMHEWVASFDLASLYPHLIMFYNMSPETLIQPKDYPQWLQDFISINKITVNHLLDEKIDTSVLKQHNITMTPNCQFFRKDVHGFLPVIMKTLYEERAIFKKKMIAEKKKLQTLTDAKQKADCERLISRYNNLQLARKIQLNSAYGALGNAYFRFFDTRLAEGITKAGQLAIKWIEKKINAHMNHVLRTGEEDYVIAVDTDSIYLRLGPLVEKVHALNKLSIGKPDPIEKTIAFMDAVCEKDIMPYIQVSYQELADYVNAYEQSMQMKREILANKVIWTAKKRYIVNVWNDEGVALKEPKMKIMGLEMIKSSTPEVCRTKMKEAVKLILNGTEDQIIEFIDKFREEFYKLPAEDVAFPRGVNGLRTYTDADTTYKKGTPIHVKGSLIYNALLAERNLLKMYPKIQDSDKIKFMYLTVPNPFKAETIAFPLRLPPALGVEEYIDYPKQFDKAFLSPLKIVLNPIGWKTEKEFTLEQFSA